MAKFLSWLIFIVVTFVVIVFAVSNLQPVTLKLWPLPFVYDRPLDQVVIGVLIVGFLAGLLLGWLIAGKARRRARAAQRRADGAQHEIMLLRDQVRRLEEAEHRREVANPGGLPVPVADRKPDAA